MEMKRVDRWLVMSLFLVVCTMVALQMFGQDPMTSVLFSTYSMFKLHQLPQYCPLYQLFFNTESKP